MKRGKIGFLLGKEVGGQSRENGRVSMSEEQMPLVANEAGFKLKDL